MRGIRIFGEYVLEIVTVTLLVALSAATVIFFVPMMVGLNGFFKRRKDDRLFKDIFVTMKENVKILIPYTIFQLVILVFPVLNIYFFNTHLESMNHFIYAVSYVALVFGGIYFITGPTIIVNMNVGFGQLLRNGFMLLFGGLIRSVICILVIVAVVAMVLYYPYPVIASFYLVPFVLTKLMTENLYVLKARVLKTNVYNLKKEESTDEYLKPSKPVQRVTQKGEDQ